MKTQTIKTLKTVSIILSLLILGFYSASVAAGKISDRMDDAQLIYNSLSVNHGIHGYPGPMLEDIAVPWNAEYADTAYGQAIFSYEKRKSK
ncbi:MAG: hypothetical protein ACU841_03165 [Gammaproteobacteria bacterium]